MVGPNTYYDTTNLWIPSVPDGVINGDKYLPMGVLKSGSSNSYNTYLNYMLQKIVAANLVPSGLGVWGHFGVDPTYVRLLITNFAYVGTPINQFSVVCNNISTVSPGDIWQIMTANVRRMERSLQGR